MFTKKKSKLPPGPKTNIPLGHLFSYRRNGIGFLKKNASKYGDIFHFKVGPIRAVVLNHPDFIKKVLSTDHHNFIKGRPLEMAREVLGNGLLTSEGAFHKRQSRIIQPAFHRKMVDSYAPVVTEYAEHLMAGWKDGMQLDLLPEMIKMSTAIAGKTLFSADLEKEAPEINQALSVIVSLFGRTAVPYSEWLLKLPLPSTFRFFKAKARLDETINKLIAKRRSSPSDHEDLLSILLRAQKENNKEHQVTDKLIRDEALTLFLTAFDTTSLALSWTFYLLSQNPEAEATLKQELDQVLQGRMPSAEDIPKLQYTRMVLGESMRILPPIYVITRQALKEYSIDQYTIPAGTLILISPYLIHHDPRFHPNPDQFDPRAWHERTGTQQSKYEYFPFGGGPRSCIGQPFAWLEGILVLAAIAQFWQLKLVPGHPIEFLQLVNLRPKHGIKMELHLRQ